MTLCQTGNRSNGIVSLVPPTVASRLPPSLGPEKRRGDELYARRRISVLTLPVPGYMRGTNMMCAFGVPGNMSHGAPSWGLSLKPVDAAVAYGT